MTTDKYTGVPVQYGMLGTVVSVLFEPRGGDPYVILVDLAADRSILEAEIDKFLGDLNSRNIELLKTNGLWDEYLS